MSERSNDVLIVDDSPEICSLVCAYLEQSGMHGREASDGADAIRAIWREPPALMLLDLNMPNFDGFEVIAKVRQYHNKIDLPIIVLSSSNREEDRARATELGANEFVSKNALFPELIAHVRSALDRWAPATKIH